MNEDVLDSNDLPNGAGRPSNLTTLCVLTFIGSGLGVLGGVLGLVGVTSFNSLAVNGITLRVLLGLLSSGLCLYGAIEMWNLRKRGFVSYLIGSGLYVVLTVLNTWIVKSSFGMFGASVNIGAIIGIGITILFVILYNGQKSFLVR